MAPLRWQTSYFCFSHDPTPLAAHPARTFRVLICRVWRSNCIDQKIIIKLRQIRSKSQYKIPIAKYSKLSAISRPAGRFFLRHNYEVGHLSYNGSTVELLVSSAASESRRPEPRLGCPSRVIPPLSLLALLPATLRRSGTPCTLELPWYGHV